jgi:hypothetical protein
MKICSLFVCAFLCFCGCATKPSTTQHVRYFLLKTQRLAILNPDGTPLALPYAISRSSITTSDTNAVSTNYFGVPSLLYVHSLTNTGLTNIVSTVTNYYGDYYIIWTQTSVGAPFAAIGVQVSNDQNNWVYYPDATNYFRITPDEFGNLGMAFGSDDAMDSWFFRGVPE